MIQISVLDSAGKQVDAVSLDEEQLGSRVRPQLLHQAVVMYEANRRVGTASAKTRAEVNGSGRKPRRQKGTGWSRGGSFQSPVWRGGGVVFGPKPRDFSRRMPKAARRLALKSALLAKFQDQEVTVIDEFDLPFIKTREMVSLLSRLGMSGTGLIVTADRDEVVWKSGRNIPGVTVRPSGDLNAYVVLRHARVLMTQDALDRVLGATE